MLCDIERECHASETPGIASSCLRSPPWGLPGRRRGGRFVRQKFNETPAARMRGRDLEAGAGRVLAAVGGLGALLGTALFHWLVHRAPYPDDD